VDVTLPPVALVLVACLLPPDPVPPTAPPLFPVLASEPPDVELEEVPWEHAPMPTIKRNDIIEQKKRGRLFIACAFTSWAEPPRGQPVCRSR
jgi:hypothetical protein